jgi:glutamate racemase
MDNPIGIFDSGIGGLTVVKQIMRLLPNENLVYFGDTARVPYGTKSKKLIQQYALEDAAFLNQFDIKLLVVACNSASATAVDLLKSTLTIPVTGVIEPGVSASLRTSRENRIGVIGTTATVFSNAYQDSIFKQNGQVKVFGQPCPLLVPLVEEGWIDDNITRLTIHKYLDPLLDNKIDTLILGCTHFPVIKETIQQEIGLEITLIDSGEETAKVVQKMLLDLNIVRNKANKGQVEFYVSDMPGKFDEIGTRFLGQPVVNANRVDFDQFLMKQGDKLYQALNFQSGSL